MLNAVTDLIRRPSVGKLTEQQAAARAELSALRVEFGAASYDAEAGDTEAAKRKPQLVRKIEGLESRLAELDAALDVAHQRETQASAEAKASEIAQRWKKAEDLAHQRAAAAQLIEADIEILMGHLAELVDLSAAMRDATPRAYDHQYGEALRVDQVVTAVRAHLAKSGAIWAHPGAVIVGRDGLPSLTRSVTEANALLLSLNSAKG